MQDKLQINLREAETLKCENSECDSTLFVEVFSFKKGDWVIFPQGMTCVWDVKESVKKHNKFG